MSKRLGAKVTLVIAALSVMTLLQGCGGDDETVYGVAWAPIGSVPIPWFFGGITPGTTVTTGGSGAVAQAGTP